MSSKCKVGRRFVFYKEDIEQIDRSLSTLIKSCEAHSAFIIHRKGQVLANHGDPENVGLDSMSSLVADSWRPLAKLGRVLGGQDPASVFVAAGRFLLRLSPIRREFLLAILLDEESIFASAASNVRVETRRLEDLFEEIESREEEAIRITQEFGRASWPGPPLAPA